MAGYIHDPLQIINLIADNLRDRYESGFPVLKEIVQNVDDAGCADEHLHLEFGLSPGLPLAGHPLLRGPALYFLNNGNFTDFDSRAIRSFGLNSKAAEQTAIGKFGLGMKSVFHFCEAFFFLAKNIERTYEVILNPWSGDDEFSSFHRNWDDFSATDAELLREHLREPLTRIGQSRDSWFLLWLPLRKKEHLLVDGEEVGSIISEFPGDDERLLSFLYDEDLTQRLTSLLPLLRRVTSIRFNCPDFQPIFEISLDTRSTRIGLAHEDRKEPKLVGAALYHNTKLSDKKYSLLYAGWQARPETPELQRLRVSSFWPKTFIRNKQGQSEEAPDRAQGHGAAVFSYSNEKGNGRLDIQWAVFLPVGEKNSPSIRCGGDTVFRLTLHGHFFIDAGRAFIEGLLDDEKGDVAGEPENEADLRKKWNRILARQGTLPLIIPALESFVARARLSTEKIWSLCEALGDSKLFSTYRNYICSQHSWVCRLTKNGREWKRTSSERCTLLLPAPPLSVPGRPWDVFPQLDTITEQGTALLLNGAPHLRLIINAQWNETDLQQVLQFDVHSVFADQGKLEYLLRFLQDAAVLPLLNYGSIQLKLRDIVALLFSCHFTSFSRIGRRFRTLSV